MTSTEAKRIRRAGLHALKAGDTVRVVRLTATYAREPVATAAVLKVLAGSIRVAWSEHPSRGDTTDFTRDAGRPHGCGWGAGCLMIEPAA